MIERIEQLRQQAEDEIIAARFQRGTRAAASHATWGARQSCRSCCAGSRAAEPEQRAAVGKAANQARAALEALIDARGRRTVRCGARRRLAPGPRGRHAARRPAAADRCACTCSPRRGANWKTSSSASASPSWRAPRWRPFTTTSTPSTTARPIRRGPAPTPSTSRRARRCCAHTPRRCRCARWRRTRRRCTW